MLDDFWFSCTHKLFKPLLLFCMGFALSKFKMPLEFRRAIYVGSDDLPIDFHWLARRRGPGVALGNETTETVEMSSI